MPLATTAESLAARLLAPTLALFCGLLPASVVLLPHWPAVQLWSFGLVLPLLAWLALGQRSRPDRRLVASLLPFFALALASAFWAFEPRGAVTLALRSLGTLLVALLLADCFARLPPALARRALRWLLPGFALGLLLLLEELLSGLALRELLGGSSFDGPRQADHLNRSALGLLLLGFVLLFFPSSTALLGCGVGLALLGLAQAAPAAGRGLLLAGLLLALPLMPLVAWAVGAAGMAGMEELGITARARAHIWDFTQARILERPWFGWGFDAAPSMPNFGVRPFFDYETKVIPLHPHSGGLQLWLDLGLVGVLLALPPLLLAWRRLAVLPAPAAAYGVALCGALLTAASLSFGLWQSRWLGLVFLALLLLRLAQRAADPD
jgi:O-antigen ligase